MKELINKVGVHERNCRSVHLAKFTFKRNSALSSQLWVEGDKAEILTQQRIKLYRLLQIIFFSISPPNYE